MVFCMHVEQATLSWVEKMADNLRSDNALNRAMYRVETVEEVSMFQRK